MAIEPQDVQKKEFSSKMRGYNQVEVDEYLDEIAFELRHLHDEIDKLNSQLTDAKSRIEYFDEMKESLNKSIMVAQDAADKVKISSKREAEFTTKEAEKEAEVVVENAHKQAQNYINEASVKAQKVVVATDDLKKQARSFRQKLEIMIESQLQMIKGRDWDNLLNSDELLTIGEIKEAMRDSEVLDSIDEPVVNSNEVTESDFTDEDVENVENEDLVDTEEVNDEDDSGKTIVVFPEDQDDNNDFHVGPKE